MVDRKEYQHQYHLARRAEYENSKGYVIKQCMKSVRKLRKEIGNHNCNLVLEALAEQARK
jgi:hypothetical protein